MRHSARSEYHQCNIAMDAAGIWLAIYDATKGAKYVFLIRFLYDRYVYKFDVDLYGIFKIACLCKN
jgi:hypothetical protein